MNNFANLVSLCIVGQPAAFFMALWAEFRHQGETNYAVNVRAQPQMEEPRECMEATVEDCGTGNKNLLSEVK